jgi:RNA polymerase subunit RPABC4/transcription elongation factor Spt4
MHDARLAWVPIATESLLRTSRTYNATITYRDLAEELQSKSGIRTKQLTHHWIGKVLVIVSTACFQSNEPLLSSLCVQQNGSVGAGFGVALDGTYGGSRPADLDLAAAEERLKCYRHFGAQMPADGGQPALTPMLAATRKKKATPARARMAVEEEREICPLCHVRLPSSGVCGSHD